MINWGTIKELPSFLTKCSTPPLEKENNRVPHQQQIFQSSKRDILSPQKKLQNYTLSVYLGNTKSNQLYWPVLFRQPLSSYEPLTLNKKKQNLSGPSDSLYVVKPRRLPQISVARLPRSFSVKVPDHWNRAQASAGGWHTIANFKARWASISEKHVSLT